MLVIVPKRSGHPCNAGPHREALGSVRQQEKNIGRAFIVFSIEKNGQGRINLLKIG